MLETPASRLKWARQHAGYHGASAAARRFGWKEPTYLGHENGSRGYDVHQATAYGAAFGVQAAWLLTGTGTPTDEIDLPLAGYISGAGEVRRYPDDARAKRVRLPAAVAGEYDVFEMRGDGAFPAYRDGDLLLVRRTPQSPRSQIGRDCIVAMKDGAHRLATIMTSGRRERFSLLPPNSEPVMDLDVAAASPVEWVKRGRARARQGHPRQSAPEPAQAHRRSSSLPSD